MKGLAWLLPIFGLPRMQTSSSDPKEKEKKSVGLK